MLRARLHLLSHKESLVLSGKQKKINFLIFIDRCGHRAKAALGAYVGPVWSQSVTGSSSFSALLQGNQPLLIPSQQSQPQSCPCWEPQQTPHLYKTMGFIQTSLLAPALGSFFLSITQLCPSSISHIHTAQFHLHVPNSAQAIPASCQWSWRALLQRLAGTAQPLLENHCGGWGAPKGANPFSAIAQGAHTLPSAFGETAHTKIKSWALQADEDIKNIKSELLKDIVQILSFQPLQ